MTKLTGILGKSENFKVICTLSLSKFSTTTSCNLIICSILATSLARATLHTIAKNQAICTKKTLLISFIIMPPIL